MHLEIDRHWDKDSPVHRLDPRLRIVAVFVWAVAILLVRSLPCAVLSLCFSLAFVLLTRIPPRDIGYRLIGVCVVLGPLLVIFPVVASAGTRNEEFFKALGMLLRGSAVVLLTFPLFNTARFHVTMSAFSALGLPRSLVALFLLSYRSLFIFLEDRRRMELAARTRGWEGTSGRSAFVLTASHVGSLLVRSVDRTERLWHAMRARGFTGSFPLLETFRIGWRDLALFLFLILWPACLLYLECAVW